MTYGIYSLSSSGTTQIDSDKPYSYFKVTQANQGITVTTSSETEIVFIKPINGVTASNDNWGADTVANGNGFIYTFKRNTTTTSVDYFVIKPTKADTPTTGYGLRIYNSDNELYFDSGVFTSALRKTVFIKQVSAINRSGDSSNSNSIIYSGSDYLSTYASLIDTATWVQNGGQQSYSGFLVWGQAGTTTIRYKNFIDLGFVSGPGYSLSLGTGFIPSPGSLISAVLIA